VEWRAEDKSADQPTHNIKDLLPLPLLLLEGQDMMVGGVEGGADEVVHCRVHDDILTGNGSVALQGKKNKCHPNGVSEERYSYARKGT
jgi:hypothetical protein